MDLVVRRGLVVDGGGGEPFLADVAISGGVVVEVGEVAARGRQEIDAAGRLVTPGFVDVHTHYDGQITWEDRLVPSSNHGVTTVVMGNCGVGFAPCRPAQRDMLIQLMEGVEDIPGVVMAEGVPWNWETFPEYLDALDKRRADIDFAAQLPHSPLRVYVMGERGASLEPPSEHDLETMRRLTTEAIRAGAIGVSTSRNFAHRFLDGRPAPSVSTEDGEVLALAEGLRAAGTGVFQILPNTDLPVEAQFDLTRRVAEASQRPVSFTFTETRGDPNAWRYTLKALKQAWRDGLCIRGQSMPRPTGALLGLELSLHPFVFNESFQPIAHLPLKQKVEAMRDPNLRRKLLSEKPSNPHSFFTYIVSDLEALYPLGDPPNYNPSPGDSIAARARRMNIDPAELIYDTLLERGGEEILYRPTGEHHGERFEHRGNIMTEDHVVIGLGDGGAHYGMICDAAFPTYVLTYWVRDAKEGRRGLSIPQAVRMLAREPAETVGLYDRGLVKPGYKADLNIIDLDRLRLHAPRVAYDLPAGGRRLSQKSEGYHATIVSGVVTYREGEATRELPGRLVRGMRPAPVAA